MSRNNGKSDRQKGQDRPPPSHLPPELNQAGIDQGKQVEAEINPSPTPEEPIQQMREGPRRRKRPTAG